MNNNGWSYEAKGWWSQQRGKQNIKEIREFLESEKNGQDVFDQATVMKAKLERNLEKLFEEKFEEAKRKDSRNISSLNYMKVKNQIKIICVGSLLAIPTLKRYQQNFVFLTIKCDVHIEPTNL